MSALKEILDGIDAVSKAIKNMGGIIDAVRAGKGYFEKRYKAAGDDVRGILEEMSKTLITASSATSIITHFSFIDDPSAHAVDLREFNNRIMDGKAEINRLRQDIDEYRGHCSKIRHHAENIKQGSGMDSIFRVFGVKSKEENEKLSFQLEEIYNEELHHYLTVNALCDNLERAITHVHETLGGTGMIQPENIPVAADLLTEYAKAFLRVESMANHKVFQIRELVRGLS